MRPRRSYRRPERESTPEGDGPGITEPTVDELAEVQARIDELKARDLAAKRSGDHSERPNIGRQIFDLMRALRAARGGDRG